MKVCNFIDEEKLTAYVDGELNDKEMLEVANHIKNCEHCKTLVEELEELSKNALFYYEGVEKSFELPNLMNDLNEKLKDLSLVTDKHTKYNDDKIIEFPNKKSKTNKTNKFYQYIPAVISLAAIFLIAFTMISSKPKQSVINSQAKKSEGVTVDSLEYTKFNAMIYKTKDKNKTVIWLFKEDDNNDDGPI